MSFVETLIILIVAMIVVGPKRMPEMARKIGKWMGVLRRAGDEFKRQLMTMDQATESQFSAAESQLDQLLPADEEALSEESGEPVENYAPNELPPMYSLEELGEAVPGGLPPDPVALNTPEPPVTSEPAAPSAVATVEEEKEANHGNA
ncbi:MAG: twin-arginine translocase TatA/TatE family subunit [Kiritimatiellia bacterium]